MNVNDKYLFKYVFKRKYNFHVFVLVYGVQIISNVDSRITKEKS